MPKTKTKKCTCKIFNGSPRKVIMFEADCPIHGVSLNRPPEAATQSFNPIKGKPEPQADLHPQTQMKPTPRPWQVSYNPISGSDGAFYITPLDTLTLPLFSPVARLNTNNSERDEANAALIVRAVNSFDDLLEALKQVLYFDGYDGCRLPNQSRAIIRAALAKAESHS